MTPPKNLAHIPGITKAPAPKTQEQQQPAAKHDIEDRQQHKDDEALFSMD